MRLWVSTTLSRPALNLEFALSGYTGEYNLRGSRINLANADVTWRSGKFEFLGEVVRAWIDPGFVEGFGGSGDANTRDPVPELDGDRERILAELED